MTNLPVTGEFRVTCEYHKIGNTWIAGHHTGIDIVNDNHIIYATCDGTVYTVKTNNKDYGNYIVILDGNGNYHYFCHLASVKVNIGDKVNRATEIGIMGSTGKSTGIHLHYEIRNPSNKYDDTINPAEYMGIPNVVGKYNSSNYHLGGSNSPELKTLARNTNLRTEPNVHANNATLYLAGTTLYVLQKGASNNDGYIWDKVKIRVNNKIGYMINKNYV